MSRPLSPAQADELRSCVYYLNLEEMRDLCRAQDLPLYIHIQRPDGSLRRSRDRDRKDLVIARILALALDHTRLGPTVYAHSVVADDPLPTTLTPRTRIRYGQYDKRNEALLRCLRQLTGGAFRSGMIARIALRDLWLQGRAPTLRQFADAWLVATAAHTQPRPEGAYLADLARGRAGPNWKASRARKASRALALIDKALA